jgi:hypothetical protein
MITVSVVLLAEMQPNGDGTVSDSTTKLMWQDDYSDNGGNIKKATWEEAIKYCEDSKLAGYNDWRLPNIRELISIVDDTKYNPAIDTSAFVNTTSGLYWSSTTYAYNHDYAWIVYFWYGYDYGGNKGYSTFVRCVRDGE